MFNLKAKIQLKIIFFFSLIALISTYFIENVLGHQPCNLCLIERIPYGLSIILISLMFIIKKNNSKIPAITFSNLFIININEISIKDAK